MKIVNFVKSIVLAFFVVIPSVGSAQISPLESDVGDSYYYTDHFEIVIDKPIADVWPHVLKMSTWMPWMVGNKSNKSSVAEGDLVNIYGNFYVEVVKIIPENMVLVVNLPSSQEGEETQGIGMVTTEEIDINRTLVSIFMSRVYFWFNERDNQLRNRRELEEFSASRRAKFKDDFLVKLKELAES